MYIRMKNKFLVMAGFGLLPLTGCNFSNDNGETTFPFLESKTDRAEKTYVTLRQTEDGRYICESSDENVVCRIPNEDQDNAPDATKQSHKSEREQFKVCALAVQYGMGAEALAVKLGVSKWRGRHLLELHRETYPRYWQWSDAVEARAVLTGKLTSTFGWQVHAVAGANPRSLRNFPLQANGAEMLRLACCLATERGIKVCAPVHDAVLVEAPSGDIDRVVAETQAVMTEASELVVPGFPLRTDYEVVRWPDRYRDPRGQAMWNCVMGVINKIGLPVGEECRGADMHPVGCANANPVHSIISY